MVKIGGFQNLIKTRLNIETNSPNSTDSTKTNKVGFIHNRPNSVSRVEEFAPVNHVIQAVVRVGSKIEP